MSVKKYDEEQVLEMLERAAAAGKAENITKITTPVADVMPKLAADVMGGTFTVTYGGGQTWSASRMGKGKAIAFITGLYIGGVEVESVTHTPKES